MAKFVALLRPREGTEPEAFWKYWEEGYSPFHIASLGLIKYAINRVIETVGGDPDGMWGYGEEWFESEEAFHASLAAHSNDTEIKKKMEDWNNRLAWKQTCLVEEKVIFEKPSAKAMAKFAVILKPKEGTDPGAFWKHWEENHAPFHAAAPGLVRYSISRLKEQLGGEPGHFWGMAEEWFDSMESFRTSRNAHAGDPEVAKKVQDWNSRLAWKQSCVVEEKVIFEK